MASATEEFPEVIGIPKEWGKVVAAPTQVTAPAVLDVVYAPKYGQKCKQDYLDMFWGWGSELQDGWS